MRKVLVIGGGAAGMMAAITAAKAGAEVTLLEKNEKTGKKIYITGKGRCNVTNGCAWDTFFENIVSNGKFLYSAYAAFDNQSVIGLLEEAGCPLKEERGERIFPVSDHSSDVIAALNRLLRKYDVNVMLGAQVREITYTEQEETEPYRSVNGVILSNGDRQMADAVIVATGGRSYEATGSTGDGYRFATESGHTVRELRPALVPFTVKEEWCRQLQGLSLKNVSCMIKKDKKKIYEGFGEMLFTHFGVSGPLMLSASSFYAKKYYGEEVLLSIDLKPALSVEQLNQRILRDFEKNKNRQFKNALSELLPAKMIPVIVMLSGIHPDKQVNEITREERMKLTELLKNLALTINGTQGFREAIITQGGVSVKEVNPSTMESKKVSGLYFAGEVLDVDALTGGFNLQVAWSTGYVAGKSAAGILE